MSSAAEPRSSDEARDRALLALAVLQAEQQRQRRDHDRPLFVGAVVGAAIGLLALAVMPRLSLLGCALPLACALAGWLSVMLAHHPRAEQPHHPGYRLLRLVIVSVLLAVLGLTAAAVASARLLASRRPSTSPATRPTQTGGSLPAPPPPVTPPPDPAEL